MKKKGTRRTFKQVKIVESENKRISKKILKGRLSENDKI